MSSLCDIKDGAIFVSDAHENENRDKLLVFLKDIKDKKIQTTQLFLLGDIFDFVTGYTEYSMKFYDKHIKLIKEISNDIEVFFIEGNHDFKMSNLFKDTSVKVFEISSQPVKFKALNSDIQIAHGDNFLPFISKYALLFLRVKPFLIFMNFVDKIFNFKISKWILNKLKFKKLDYKIPNFKELIRPKLRYYNADYVIEGHYHQGCVFDIENKKYINLPCFACNQSYFIVEYENDKIKFIKKNLKGH
ncbi:UDP-2,3-diacylglucosamine hydrolase [Campylobacter pinnipediorum subsp. pinnipediorum]|uniref:UDP-2,3-diacylglucosamine hydrolase n=1 Tax=Campylobacter pinnipediorum subsp. pinnipediorum TaxID=1660067 RepID=A0AAX0L936_9BACT|nr:UDP-2,3-diacylglucosamine diphosphatase [Campylobacter pinnipediorum]OPA76455.1 UDP-2,3-diacylglucosamine hydrolase [Campylobacter pinnipediorum subsp. pinnipediorum]